MKKMILLLTLSILLADGMAISAPNFNGAWQKLLGNNVTTLLLQDGYFTKTSYSGSKFDSSWGGIASVEGNVLRVNVEYHTSTDTRKDTMRTMSFTLNKDELVIDGSIYRRIDNGQAPLAGVWKISARKQEGKLTPIHGAGPRKTLKILTGNRFQWIAINSQTREFFGSGGGTYTFENGKYTENIDFFSRDSSRVGAQLSFDGKIEDGKWHHSGLSSRGDEIYEVWEKVNL